MPMIAIISTSDQGHQSNLPVRMGMYIGEEGVRGSGKVYRGEDGGGGGKEIIMWYVLRLHIIVVVIVNWRDSRKINICRGKR